jgi:hypothetical protein
VSLAASGPLRGPLPTLDSDSVSTSEVSVPATFFDRARREAERYGEDPWIFLRELVQNARDAGASTIAFSASRSDVTETVVCDDDGCGMTRSDVSRYLLRLYASRKSEDAPADERAEGAVGRFGVGFWSVLRFGPAVIRVDSRTADGALGLEVDCVRQTIREVPTMRQQRGTRVTLIRPARELKENRSFVGLVGERLKRYAGTVRGIDGAKPPALLLEGRPLNRALSPRGFIAEHIRGRGFEGVIGLADRPGVRLYAHGLLVKEVASLEELLPRRGRTGVSAAPGLYPSAEINADGLEVLLDRQAVVEDKLLETIVANCDRRLGRLRRRLLDRLAPLPLLSRLLLALNQPRKLLAIAAALCVVVASAATGFLIVNLTGGSFSGPGTGLSAPRHASVTSARRIEDALLPGAGPVINTPEGPAEASSPWDIHYVGEGRPFIKLQTQGTYDPQRGLIADRIHLVGRYVGEPDPHAEGYEADELGYTLFVGVSGERSKMVLPVPVGHRVIEGSVLIDGTPVRTLGVTPHDEPVALALPEDSHRLRYRTRPARRARRPGPIDRPPDEAFPDHALDVLDEVDAQPRVASKVKRVARFVKKELRYTTSVADAARFLQHQDRPWITRVLDYGAGDCDVMNGLNVLTLQAAGVPARLGVGFVGERGVVASDLHAWTEYWDGERWKMLDVSPPRYVPTLAPITSRDDQLDLDGADAPSALPASDSAALPAGLEGMRPLDDEERGFAWGVVGALVAAALLLLLVAGALLLRERRRRRSPDEDDRVALALLEHLLRDGSGHDPLHLRHRPMFATLNKGRISLARVEQLARQGRLVAAHHDNPLLNALPRGLPVLDRDDPRVERFRSRLRDLILLEDLGGLLDGRQRHPALLELQHRLQSLDSGVRVHGLEASMSIRELALPTRRDAALSPRHLFIGLLDPCVRDALALWEHDQALARFRLLARVLEQTTLYLEARDDLLATLAREAL